MTSFQQNFIVVFRQQAIAKHLYKYTLLNNSSFCECRVVDTRALHMHVTVLSARKWCNAMNSMERIYVPHVYVRVN